MDTIERLVDMSNVYEPIHELKTWLRKNQRDGVTMRLYEHRVEFSTEDNVHARKYHLLHRGEDLRGRYHAQMIYTHLDYPGPLLIVMDYPMRSGGLHVVRACTSWHQAEHEWALLRAAIEQQYRMHQAFENLELVMRAANDAAATWRNYLHREMQREMTDDTQAS